MVDADEAVTADWRAHTAAVDVIRVKDPPPADWPRLTDQGFLPRPEWVTRVAPPALDEDGFLARVLKKQRYHARAALRKLADQGARTELVQSIDPTRPDEFLRLYERQVEQMRNGLPMARLQRDDLLGAAEHYFLIHVYDALGALIAGLCYESRTADTVRLPFLAIEPRLRATGLGQALAVRAAVIAGTRG